MQAEKIFSKLQCAKDNNLHEIMALGGCGRLVIYLFRIQNHADILR